MKKNEYVEYHPYPFSNMIYHNWGPQQIRVLNQKDNDENKLTFLPGQVHALANVMYEYNHMPCSIYKENNLKRS